MSDYLPGTSTTPSLDLHYGPERKIISYERKASGRTYALLECGHRMRATYMREHEFNERTRCGYPPSVRCSHCREIARRAVS